MCLYAIILGFVPSHFHQELHIFLLHLPCAQTLLPRASRPGKARLDLPNSSYLKVSSPIPFPNRTPIRPSRAYGFTNITSYGSLGGSHSRLALSPCFNANLSFMCHEFEPDRKDAAGCVSRCSLPRFPISARSRGLDSSFMLHVQTRWPAVPLNCEALRGVQCFLQTKKSMRNKSCVLSFVRYPVGKRYQARES